MSPAATTSGPPDYVESKSKAVRMLVALERVVGSAVLLSTLALVLVQVVSRYILSSPISWTEELARFSLIWLTFVGAGFVMARRAHITVDLFVDILGLRAQRYVNGFAIVVILLASAAVSWGGLQMILGTMDLQSPAAGVPMPLVYSAVTTGFVLIFIHGLINTIFDLKSGRSMKPGSSELEAGGAA